ncbi:hypothetical protein WJR50_13805 [Catalinimonas sp. 4WD22]|uniref:hypothetical protein n=1 Tax=Catalinimonas locisalis TaxID=3133978 RepID=UPI003100D61A
MAFAPHGSFNPKEVGFWISIMFGLTTSFGTSYILYIMHKKYGDDRKEEAEGD